MKKIKFFKYKIKEENKEIFTLLSLTDNEIGHLQNAMLKVAEKYEDILTKRDFFLLCDLGSRIQYACRLLNGNLFVGDELRPGDKESIDTFIYLLYMYQNVKFDLISELLIEHKKLIRSRFDLNKVEHFEVYLKIKKDFPFAFSDDYEFKNYYDYYDLTKYKKYKPASERIRENYARIKKEFDADDFKNWLVEYRKVE